MLKYIGIACAGIVTSFVLFPTEFVWFPSLNTKNIAAGIGLVLLLVNLSRRRTASVPHELLPVAIWAGGVSLISFVTMVYNSTNDDSYLTYIVSMCIWLSASYLFTTVICAVHGYISVKLVANYLIAVCAVQCVIAMAMEQIPAFNDIVNAVFITGKETLAKGRLCGIGASVDVAGLRFMAVLAITAYLIKNLSEEESRIYLKWYLMAFAIISFIGNMISRTTAIGTVLGLTYLAWNSIFGRIRAKVNLLRLWRYITISTFIIIVCGTVLYNTNQSFRNNMRYGFEGFFSLYEQGKWEVNSNNSLIWMLKNVMPETTRTWIIGDGYCSDPHNDPYYTGKQAMKGFYMLTDVGYQRFVFYFGVIGLLVFMAYFCQVASSCTKIFPRHKEMFLLILLCNFIGWFKVSTDLFVVFAAFLSIAFHDRQEEVKDTQELV